jgi:hypothetical protein
MSSVEVVIDTEGREECRQSNCAEGAIARIPKDHGPSNENDHRYRQADIRVTNRLFHFLTHADKSPRKNHSADKVDEGERGSNATADISAGKRAFLDVDSRRSSNQPQDSGCNASQHDTRADRRRQRLGYSRKRSDLRESHATDPDSSRFMRGAQNVPNLKLLRAGASAQASGRGTTRTGGYSKCRPN